jgi:hypothetical protein
MIIPPFSLPSLPLFARHDKGTDKKISSGNLKLAQALARPENIQITQRYAHIDDDELDKGYYEIFEKKDTT